jgi:hypothetical protein
MITIDHQIRQRLPVTCNNHAKNLHVNASCVTPHDVALKAKATLMIEFELTVICCIDLLLLSLITLIQQVTYLGKQRKQEVRGFTLAKG